MGSAITFYFKNIFPAEADFTTFISGYNIADLSDAKNLTFAKYLYKIMYREFANSNIQYLTPDEFKLDLANYIEDYFEQYKKQIALADSIYQLTNDQLVLLNRALANSANNPNTEVDDPTEPLAFISNQTYTQIKDNELQAYLRAISLIPSKRIREFLTKIRPLFKTYIPNQIFIYKGEDEE